ncbi:hypothetical protein LSCM1_06584 [Leishmania martiniquensis]|uniref:MIT domain-containing protein n=1 Tax=Leishmania martiniquensis TaxID=1580590 RepID=A0A836KT75_9TRYP|nr:hypothetical protein LSCM1_06584 [Leishmania martiniquensis]
MTAADQLRHAAQLIELARGEETEDGNPLTAVRHYTTAMEIIASEASRHAATISNSEARRFFLFQIRSKLEMYYERAELLLQVANGSGLLDKPSPSSGDASAFQTGYPPALFAATMANERDSSSKNGAAMLGAGGDGSVLGIPLQPQQTNPPAPLASTQFGYADTREPPISCYLKNDDGTVAPPSETPELDLDELLKNLGAPPEP